MTFNAAEAAAFETILYWVGVPNVSGDRPTDDQARQAFQLLGDSEFKATGVGCRPEDIRVAVEHTAARINRWADGREREEWRVLLDATMAGDVTPALELLSTVDTFTEAAEDLRVSGRVGIIEHRRLWESDWREVDLS